MVLFKLIKNQTNRKFHTFHFKFKRDLNYLNRIQSIALLRPHSFQEPISKKLFNIGGLLSCRMSSSINPIIIEPRSTHKATLLFFHGLGDTGSGWSDYWRCLGLPNLKIILPTAPSNKVTLNMGMKMPSWFDIYGLNIDSKEDEDGINKMKEYVHSLIEEEMSKTGLSSDKILLGGFSQGGALAIYSALTYEKKLAGCVLYSCWLPLNKQIRDKLSAENSKINIIQCHGDSDFVVPLDWGKMTADILTNKIKNDNVTFKVYSGMGHSGCAEESSDTKEYLTNLLSKI